MCRQRMHFYDICRDVKGKFNDTNKFAKYFQQTRNASLQRANEEMETIQFKILNFFQ